MLGLLGEFQSTFPIHQGERGSKRKAYLRRVHKQHLRPAHKTENQAFISPSQAVEAGLGSFAARSVFNDKAMRAGALLIPARQQGGLSLQRWGSGMQELGLREHAHTTFSRRRAAAETSCRVGS